MSKFVIEGGRSLEGNLNVFGAKNACLPIICSSLLSSGTVILRNIPKLRDISLLADIIKNIGCSVDYNCEDRTLKIEPEIEITDINKDASKMRASILLIAPLLAKKGRVKISYPGGCSIGGRPIDITIDGLKALGVSFEDNSEYLIADTKDGLKGARFELRFPSVGATEILIMAASLAKGETVLSNVAIEPEIVDTIDFLNSMGAKIEFVDERVIRIIGVDNLSGTDYSVVSDRIITGTYAIIAALCAGDKGVSIKNCNPGLLKKELSVLESSGVKMEIKDDEIYIPKQDYKFKPVDFETAVYDGFATDLQAPMMMFLTQAEGVSRVKENIYENRFMHVEHLNNMNADIEIISRSEALIKGNRGLRGAEVRSTDLRASAALVIAGLIAEGETVLDEVEHLDRGYEELEKVLNSVGANIKRESD